MLSGSKTSTLVDPLLKRQVDAPPLSCLNPQPPPEGISEARLDTLVKHILDFNPKSYYSDDTSNPDLACLVQSRYMHI